MVYSFGVCIWSLYNSGMLPYEDSVSAGCRDQKPNTEIEVQKRKVQNPEQLVNRAHRLECSLPLSEECMPAHVIEVSRLQKADYKEQGKDQLTAICLGYI